MPLHSYTRCWLHIVWATIERRPLLEKPAAAKLSAYLHEYANEKGIYMKINFVNADHTHVLVDLPASMAIEEVVQLLKGGSSHWVNESNLVPGKFGWQRGYGAFSVSHSAVDEVCAYVANQEEHHRRKTFAEELKRLVKRYGLKWHEEENR
ncbi:MAG: IS200/IS605 family transposase [Limisphaerales bacterium]